MNSSTRELLTLPMKKLQPDLPLHPPSSWTQKCQTRHCAHTCVLQWQTQVMQCIFYSVLFSFFLPPRAFRALLNIVKHSVFRQIAHCKCSFSLLIGSATHCVLQQRAIQYFVMQYCAMPHFALQHCSVQYCKKYQFATQYVQQPLHDHCVIPR